MIIIHPFDDYFHNMVQVIYRLEFIGELNINLIAPAEKVRYLIT